MRELELGELHLYAKPCCDGKCADVVVLRRDEVGEALVGFAFGTGDLLAQAAPGHDELCTVAQLDIVAMAFSGEEAEHCPSSEPLFSDDAVQHGLRVSKYLPCLFADAGVVENARVLAGQIPGLEKRAPIDVFGDDR